MSQEELMQRWVIHRKVSPLPDPWLQTGVICSCICNAAGAKTKPLDFIPVEKEHKKGNELFQHLKLLAQTGAATRGKNR